MEAWPAGTRPAPRPGTSSKRLIHNGRCSAATIRSGISVGGIIRIDFIYKKKKKKS